MFIYVIKRISRPEQCLIGQTHSPEYRWIRHRCDARANRHPNIHFQRAWNKYGEEDFEFVVLTEAKTQEELNRIENIYVKLFGYYNLRAGGNCGGRLSEETKKKISKANLGNKPWNKGIPRSQEIKTKISESKKGSEPWNKGRPWTKKERKRISESLIGRALSKEEKDKRSKRNYPILVSPEGKEYKVKNLSRFCRERALSRYGVWAIVNGYQKTCYGGWRVKK